MVKRHRQKAKAKLATQPQSLEALIQEFQQLRQHHHYAQATKKLEQIQRAYPEAKEVQDLPDKGELLHQLGQHQMANQQMEPAERSFQQAIEHRYFAAYYNLAKLYLDTDRLTAAHTLLQTAFDDKTLPKDLGGAYLKVLFLVDALDEVALLLSTKANRFYAHHRNWAQTVLELQRGTPPDQLQGDFGLFSRLRKPITPNEPQDIWYLYGLLIRGGTDLLPFMLGMAKKEDGFRLKLPIETVPEHPVLAAVAWAFIHREQLPVHPHLRNQIETPSHRTALLLLSILHAVEHGQYTEAVQGLRNLDWNDPALPPEFPELAKVILHVGADRLWMADDVKGAELALSLYLSQFGFEIDIALKQLQCLDYFNENAKMRQNLTEIYAWVEAADQENPQEWPLEYKNQILCEILCRQFASYARGRELPPPSAGDLLRRAEALKPDYYVLKGYQGLWALTQQQTETAIAKLMEAMEGDSQGEYYEFYDLACHVLERMDDSRLDLVHQRFGKQYDDEAAGVALPGAAILKMPAWKRIFISPSIYSFVEEAQECVENSKAPATQEEKLYRLFCLAIVQGLNEEVGVRQSKATFETETLRMFFQDVLTAATTPEEKCWVLGVICITIARFVKRKKGVSDLFKKFYAKLEKLAKTHEDAMVPAWIARILWDNKLNKFQSDLEAYLDRQPNPVLALAQLQLELRYFATSDLLRPLLEDYADRDSSVPEVYLAIATTFSPKSKEYKAYQERSFKLAQRLQDQGALEANRIETETVSYIGSQNLLLGLVSGRFSPGSRGGLDDFRLFLRSIMGQEISDADLAMLLPELLARMGSGNFDL